MPREPKTKRKPRPNVGPYTQQRAPRHPKPSKDAPKTSAKPAISKKRDNLTLHDWMSVYAFVDSHPGMKQGKVVEHFMTRAEGALVFTQSTLSRKLRNREEMESRVDDNPTALSGKCARVVTRPDVEQALVIWTRQMEAKGESYTGPMLLEKRKRFEKEFDVPEDERLSGAGWVQSFCKTCVLLFKSVMRILC